MGLLNAAIYMGLMSDPPEVEPVFWQARERHVITMHWCQGFTMAVMLRVDEWGPFMKTEERAELMVPILVHMFDEEGNSMLGFAQQEIDEALEKVAEVIPEVVPVIFKRIGGRSLV